MQYEKGECHMDWQMNKLVMKRIEEKYSYEYVLYLLYDIFCWEKKKKVLQFFSSLWRSVQSRKAASHLWETSSLLRCNSSSPPEHCFIAVLVGAVLFAVFILELVFVVWKLVLELSRKWSSSVLLCFVLYMCIYINSWCMGTLLLFLTPYNSFISYNYMRGIWEF